MIARLLLIMLPSMRRCCSPWLPASSARRLALPVKPAATLRRRVATSMAEDEGLHDTEEDHCEPALDVPKSKAQPQLSMPVAAAFLSRLHSHAAYPESAARADKDVAGKYMTAFFYTGEYEEWQKGHIARLLELAPSSRLVDIGGGTGRFAQLLREAGGLEQEALCVDPSAGMLEEASKIPGITTECAGGLEFAQKAGETYDRALIKEVVHHLPDDDLREMFRGIYAQLSVGGVCVTCTRPHVVQYPFFDAALEVWKRQQPPMEHYVSIMEEAGFQVSCEVCDYPATLGTEWWLEMVGNRFWSTFSHFSDEELAAGIAEIKEKHGTTASGEPAETISFTEQMVFITASKRAPL